MDNTWADSNTKEYNAGYNLGYYGDPYEKAPENPSPEWLQGWEDGYLARAQHQKNSTRDFPVPS